MYTKEVINLIGNDPVSEKDLITFYDQANELSNHVDELMFDIDFKHFIMIDFKICSLYLLNMYGEINQIFFELLDVSTAITSIDSKQEKTYTM